MTTDRQKEKTQTKYLSKFSDHQIHGYTILADSVYHELKGVSQSLCKPPN